MAKTASTETYGPPDERYKEYLTPHGTFGVWNDQILTFEKDAKGNIQPVHTKIEIVAAPEPAAEPAAAPAAAKTPPAAPKKKSATTK